MPFSTDFGNIQRMYLGVMPLKIENWKTLYDDMDADGNPEPGSIWAKRAETLAGSGRIGRSSSRSPA